jgi:hypothetical protein
LHRVNVICVDLLLFILILHFFTQSSNLWWLGVSLRLLLDLHVWLRLLYHRQM